jgi:hypothetical protein
MAYAEIRFMPLKVKFGIYSFHYIIINTETSSPVVHGPMEAAANNF